MSIIAEQIAYKSFSEKFSMTFIKFAIRMMFRHFEFIHSVSEIDIFFQLFDRLLKVSVPEVNSKI
jgi:hypothetical protein